MEEQPKKKRKPVSSKEACERHNRRKRIKYFRYCRQMLADARGVKIQAIRWAEYNPVPWLGGERLNMRDIVSVARYVVGYNVDELRKTIKRLRHNVDILHQRKRKRDKRKAEDARYDKLGVRVVIKCKRNSAQDADNNPETAQMIATTM